MQKDKRISSNLDYDEIEFPVSNEDFIKIETKNNIFINAFGYESKLSFLIYLSDQKLQNPMDMLLLINEKSHYVYIKDFD